MTTRRFLKSRLTIVLGEYILSSKIIIVDDEIKIVQLIEVLIDWKHLPLKLVGTANDGISALELIKNRSPDIVILDMKMPGFNGIELICRSKELNPEIHFIIISGYKKFEYAQSAIKYGVEDYLLKPVKEDELNNTLIKVINKIENSIINKDLVNHFSEIENRELEEKFFNSIIANSHNDEFDRNILKNRYNINLHYNYFEIVLIKNDLNVTEINDNEIILLQEKTDLIVKRILNVPEISFYMHKNIEGFYLFLNYELKNKDIVRDKLILIIEQLYAINDLFCNLKTTIARSEEFSSLKDIHEKMLSVIELIQDRVVCGCGKLLVEDNSKNNNIKITDIYTQPIKNSMVKYIEILDEDGLKRILDEIQLDILSLKQSICGKLVFDIVAEILDTFRFALKRRNSYPQLLDEQLLVFKNIINLQSNVPALFSLLNSKIIEIIKQEKKNHKAQVSQPIVEVKKYINENFFMNITLDSVSQFIHMNPTYFSTLFKKETGIGFLEYLTTVRIEEAKELLGDPKRLISDTASEVGYKDTKHFTKQFKKIVGLSPIEYRKIYY